MTDASNLPPTEAFPRRSRRPTPPAPAPRGDGPDKPPTGIMAIIAKHPVAWLVGAVAVLFVLLSVGAVNIGIAAGSKKAVAAVEEPGEDAAPARAQPAAIPAGSLLKTCSVSDEADAKLLAKLYASVVDVDSGAVLYERRGTDSAAPAGGQLLLTAAAAMQALGPDKTLTTKVFDGSSAGSIVLVGGGDPTLATDPDTVYEGAAQISDLAAAAMIKYQALHPGVPITEIVLDSTMWSPSDDWDDSWPASLRSSGYMPYVTALMVDGDRDNPDEAQSPRGGDPIKTAGKAFASAAGLPDVTFTNGTAVSSTELASVESQPVGTLIEQMLLAGDDAIAESLARAISVESGFDGSSGSLGQAIPAALDALGLDDAGDLKVQDGSGESSLNEVPARFLARLLVMIKDDKEGLGDLLDAMPVAGETGDLFDRFTDSNADAAGEVVAVPGWIGGDRSLSGVINAEDGTDLAFAFYAIGDDVEFETRTALDALAAAVFRCGANLSQN